MSYDPLDNLTQVSQDAQTRTFEYSSLSRLQSATNPESGETLYTYYDSGDLKTREYDGGVLATFTYDAMHRIVNKTYTSVPATPEVDYEYYPANAGGCRAGQLSSVSSTAATTVHQTYDCLGRVTSSSHSIEGYAGAFPFQYQYWLHDGVKQIMNPSGRVIDYEVDDAGRTTAVSSGTTDYADLTGTGAYTPDGRIAQMKFGNGLWETRSYDTLVAGPPAWLQTQFKLGTTVGAADKLNLTYNFSGTANNGNLQQHGIQQPGGSWQQDYSYDGVNRLLTAGEVNGWSRSYGYDRFGNRWVSASSGLSWTDPHEPISSTNFSTATNRLSVAGSSYDAAGNQTVYAPWTLGYDGENRNVSAWENSSSNGAFAYDGDGRRVKKTWTAGATTTTTFYVYNALGQLSAEYSTQAATPGTFYLHTDMLGSTRMLTDSAGATVECYDHLPFGRLLSSTDNNRSTGCYPANPDSTLNSRTPQKFTGKERDPETRLDFFGARYYSAAQGRFLSTDIEGPDVTNPQTLNKYRYALNNPLRFIDPNGKYEIDVHKELTTVLALASGFSKFAADRVGINTYAVDERPETNPTALRNLNFSKEAVEMRANYHFTTEQRRDHLWDIFQKSGSYVDLGVFLHAEQDSFSHRGYTAEKGHATDLSAPDKTFNDPSKADTMALRTYTLLQSAAQRLGQNGKQVPWDLISTRVRDFNRAKKTKDKDRILGDLRRLIEGEQDEGR